MIPSFTRPALDCMMSGNSQTAGHIEYKSTYFLTGISFWWKEWKVWYCLAMSHQSLMWIAHIHTVMSDIVQSYISTFSSTSALIFIIVELSYFFASCVLSNLTISVHFIPPQYIYIFIFLNICAYSSNENVHICQSLKCWYELVLWICF